MNNKPTLSIHDVEAAMLLPFHVSVPKSITKLSNLTTRHQLHSGKQIVMIVSTADKENQSTEKEKTTFYPKTRTLLSANVNQATASLNGSISAYDSYQLLAPVINSCAQSGYSAHTFRQTDYSSFNELMQKVAGFLSTPSTSKLNFVYVETDEKIITEDGLTKSAKPISDMIQKTALDGALTVVTSAPKKKNNANHILPLLVLAPLLEHKTEYVKSNPMPDKRMLQPSVAKRRLLNIMTHTAHTK